MSLQVEEPTMPVFERHFTIDQANALLPQLRRRFATLHDLDRQLLASAEEHRDIFAKIQNDVGGPALSRHFGLHLRWRRELEALLRTGVLVKDLERGLCDFPHLLGDGQEEVFLCWELSEPEVAHWHRLDEGYPGRIPLGRRVPRR